MNYGRLSSGTVLGGVVALVGLVLLARTTGLYDTGPLLRYVPSLFVLVGLYALVASGFRSVTGPVPVVLVAGTWQLAALDVVRGSTVLDLWPVLVVLLGLSIALGQVRPRPAGTEGDYLNAFALFGGVERRATSPAFRRADLTALFGGTTLDLREVERAPGSEPIRANATVLFGGAEVVRPLRRGRGRRPAGVERPARRAPGPRGGGGLAPPRRWRGTRGGGPRRERVRRPRRHRGEGLTAGHHPIGSTSRSFSSTPPGIASIAGRPDRRPGDPG